MKKRLSLILALAMVVSLFAGLGLTASAAEPALSVYTQTGEGETVLAKAYTAEELAAIAEKSEGASYVYYKKDTENAVVATEYVTLSALLADAGVAYAESDFLSFTCADGPYSKGDFSYETMSARGVDQTGAAVPTAFALTWGSGSLAEGTVAGIAAEAKNSGSIRFVSGMTADEAAEKSAAGNRMPSDVVAVTVVSPVRPAFEIYTQAGKGADSVLAKSYTAEELAALAEKSEGTSYVYYKKDVENAVVATEYVTLSAILADAGVEFTKGDSLAFTCDDGPYSKGDFSYETVSARGVDQTGAAVPTALALTWDNGSLVDGTVASIAASAKNTGSIRFVCGMTAEEAAEKSAAGNRMPSGVVSVTVVGKPVCKLSTQSLKVNGFAVKGEVYNISGYNYFKLRDVAQLLSATSGKFAIDVDNDQRIVKITTGKAYTAVGGELSTGTDKSATCVLSTWTIEINGEAQEIVAYNIGGNNFFKLRDLGDALGFGVDYDQETHTMLVTSK